MAQTDYDRYVRDEWGRFTDDPSYRNVLLDAVGTISVRRVLDVGCGAGQMLTPFLEHPETLGIGVDLSEEVGLAGRELIKARNPRARAAFVRAGAEVLPWRAETFDVVICRLALPYTDNERALREMARVLRPGGVLLLKIHHFRYYLDEMWRAFVQHRGRQVVHDARVLAAGTIYCLIGRQPRNRVFGTESFQTLWLLKRELRRCGLLVKREMGDSTRETPSFVVAKPAGDAG